jgi:HSP20 family molecular chaperone IbpA
MRREGFYMTAEETKALEAKDKQELSSPTEQTKPGLTFTPAVDIFENDKEITLLADMPGVKAKDLDIDLREDVLTLSGEVESPENSSERAVLREYRTGRYVRQFTLSDRIDQSKIAAQLKEGVLRLSLPMAEKASPKKIKVKAR